MKTTLDAPQSSPAERFTRGMGRLAAHVTILTSCSDRGDRCGLAATAVASLTAEPPSLVACVNKQTWVGSVLPDAGRFCVNALTSEQRHLAEVFAGMTGVSGASRFDHGEWTTAVTGAPVLVGALTSFDCRLDHLVERSTHWLIVGKVEATIAPEHEGDSSAGPLLYVARRFAGIAP